MKSYANLEETVLRLQGLRISRLEDLWIACWGESEEGLREWGIEGLRDWGFEGLSCGLVWGGLFVFALEDQGLGEGLRCLRH